MLLVLIQLAISHSPFHSTQVVATDCHKRIMLVLSGMPRDKERWQEVISAARAAMDAAFTQLEWTPTRTLPTKKSRVRRINRRGPHHTAAQGLSFGGGQGVS